MDKRAYWIWLQHAFQAGSTKPKSIYRRYNDLEEFYNGGKFLWASLSFITEKELKLLENYDIKIAEAVIDYCEKTDKKIITPESPEYPKSLWEINDPPAVLYVRGMIPNLDYHRSMAIVGSRKASDQSLFVAETISYELAKEGFVIVSGGAIGVDTSAHKGAVKGGAPTIAVLGCGLDYPYLMENELLRQNIVGQGGALITEYPPSMGVLKGTFQTRNRIISAISDGVLIVSAEKKSGTMITARRATEQNKDIFAVPGNPLLPTSEGPNQLIKDGAVPVTESRDILDFYGSGFKDYFCEDNVEKETPVLLLNPRDDNSSFLYVPDRFKMKNDLIDEEIELENKGLAIMLEDDEFKSDGVSRFCVVKILTILSQESCTFDELCIKAEVSPSDALVVVTNLEMEGKIESISGQRYKLK